MCLPGGGTTIIDIIREATKPKVGRYYFSDDDESPATIWPNTVWEKLAEGTFLMAAGETTPAGSTGGAAQVTLTEAEMPVHTHKPTYLTLGVVQGTSRWYFDPGTAGTEAPTSGSLKNAGGGQPHENRPPFLATNVWRRTA